MSTLLLDTCAIIWTGTDAEILENAVAELDRCFDEGSPVYVSPFSAWELGILVSRARLRLPLDVAEWFENYMKKSGFNLVDLTPAILIASSNLPGNPPKDPADRVIIATARQNNYSIMTRDRAILSYADQGHVKAMPC